MDRALADLAAQEADLLPTRLTLGCFNDGFNPGFSTMRNMTHVHSLNLSVGSDGPAVAAQTINAR